MKIEFPELIEVSERLALIEKQMQALFNLVTELKVGLMPKVETRKFKVNELAEVFAVERETVYNWMGKGLKYEVIGGRRYIYESDLIKWIEKDNRLKQKFLSTKHKET